MCSTALPRARPAFVDAYARPVINSSVELAEWDHFVASSGWRGGVGLHVDTGMNRLGLSIEETAAVATRMQSENHGLALLMSHFACADQPQHPLNDQQIRQFREIRTLFRGIPGSLANSSGIFLDQSAYCDMVRPGAALYGVNPTPGRPNPMKPVVELQGRVLQVRSVPRNAAVGYGATWTAKRASRIAVVAAGYADGIAARRGRDRPRGDRRRQALPHRRAHLDGSDGGGRHRLAGQRGAARQPGDADRRRAHRRRGRRAGRHHRLRGADLARPRYHRIWKA